MTWQETCRIIPEGVCTLSKRPCCHIPGVYPNYIVSGNGCTVVDENGKSYIDWPCSLGANILGYGFGPVVEAVKTQMEDGTLFSLSHPRETELAELLRDTIPSMEMMRFLKTGTESCMSAVKIARAYTGRQAVICCGYHGHAEWYNCTTPKNAGSVRQDVTPVKWGDTAKLEELFIEKKPAAFITEPYVYEDEESVKRWLSGIRVLCDKYKVVLIFDENVTGFRTRKLSAQRYWDIKPDLTCLGKAMANGVPMACVGGNRDIMDVLTGDCFVSSTFGGDLLGISAAIATISYLKGHPVTEQLWTMGSKLKTAFNQAAQSIMQQDTTKCIGLPCRTHFVFPTAAHKGLFWQICLEQGIFFGHAQFVSYAHNMPEVDKTCLVVRYAMTILNKHWDNPGEMLRGPAPAETLRLVTVPAPREAPMPVPQKIAEAKPDAVGFVAQDPPKDKPAKRKPGRPRTINLRG